MDLAALDVRLCHRGGDLRAPLPSVSVAVNVAVAGALAEQPTPRAASEKPAEPHAKQTASNRPQAKHNGARQAFLREAKPQVQTA